MKVLHILNEIRFSGAEVMLKVAAPHWREMGLELHALSTGEQPGVFVPQLESAGYTIHHLPFAKRVSFFAVLYRLLRQNSFDVVHIHTERANFYYALIAKLAGVRRAIRTIHSNFPFKGYLGFKRRIQRAIMRWIGVSQVSVAPGVKHTEKYFFGNPTTLINNWYDEQHFRPPTPTECESARQALELPPDVPVIVSVGNCSPVKNHPLLLEALANLRDVTWVYLHIGQEESGFPERRQAEHLGIGDRICFLGFQSDPHPFYWAADLYVMPSLYEGSSISTIEALATGLLVLLADVSGLRDLQTVVPGIVYVKPDIESLTLALRSVICKPLQYVDREKPRATRVVREQFGARRGAGAYLNLYRQR
jgi:glycosyltransferase involved in cell wall biosynthesis